MQGENMSTWAEAVKAALIALPILGRLAERFFTWNDGRRKRRAQDKAGDAVARPDPDALGRELRDRMR